MTNSYSSKEMQKRVQINAKPKLKKLIESYHFYDFSNELDIDKLKISFEINTNSEIAIINKYQINEGKVFFIIIFQNSIIIIRISLLHLLAPLFCKKSELKNILYFLQDTKDIFNQQMQNTDDSNIIQIECDESINEEINNFNAEIYGFTIANFEYSEILMNMLN